MMEATVLKRTLVAALLVGLAASAAAGATGKGPSATSQRFNIVCTLDHLIGNERYVGSDHAPIPARERAEYAVDLRTARFQERDPPYVSDVRTMAELNDREALLIRTSEEFVAFRRKDLYMVQAYSGPEHDVRVMAGSCRRAPFTPFETPGRR
jgi:hypothetical protein